MVDEAGLGVVFYNGIGDAILALPALRAIAKFVGDFRLVCPAGAPYQFIFSEFAKHLVPCPVNLAESFSPEDLWAILGRPPRVIFLTTWRNSSFDKWESFARGRILTFGPIVYSKRGLGASPEHYFDLYMSLSAQITSDKNLSNYAYAHQPDVVRTIPSFALTLTDRLKMPWVFHAETRREKMISPQFWNALTSLVLSSTTSDIVFVGNFDVSKAHRGSGRVFQSRRHFPLCAHLVSRASVFIGIDSCFLHYADLQGAPCIGIFTSTDPAYWGPRLSARRAVMKADATSPFNARSCYELACVLLSRGE